jgi:hypothetical protein
LKEIEWHRSAQETVGDSSGSNWKTFHTGYFFTKSAKKCSPGAVPSFRAKKWRRVVWPKTNSPTDIWPTHGYVDTAKTLGQCYVQLKFSFG